jgi:hypothetical protein
VGVGDWDGCDEKRGMIELGSAVCSAANRV